jgi:hypothetical protein
MYENWSLTLTEEKRPRYRLRVFNNKMGRRTFKPKTGGRKNCIMSLKICAFQQILIG